MRERFITTEDGVKIAFNHYHSGKNSVIIIAHGWYMCKDAMPFLKMSEDFHKNYDIITFDFRGHGKSSGWYTFTSNEHYDINAVINYAKKRYSKIALLGFSLGGALSIIHTAKHKNIDCIVTVSAPVAFNKIENHIWKPEAFISSFKKFNLKENRNVRPGNIFLKKTNPIDIVMNISPIPSLFLGGSKDPTIFPWHTELLFEKAKKPSSIEIFEGGLHAEDLYLNSAARFIFTCNNWFKKYLS